MTSCAGNGPNPDGTPAQIVEPGVATPAGAAAASAPAVSATSSSGRIREAGIRAALESFAAARNTIGRMSAPQLAQLNVARAIAPLDSEPLESFMAAIDGVNALADAAPGFVWRLEARTTASIPGPPGSAPTTIPG